MRQKCGIVNSVSFSISPGKDEEDEEDDEETSVIFNTKVDTTNGKRRVRHRLETEKRFSDYCVLLSIYEQQN